MGLSTGTLITDAFAIVAVVVGFHLAFRQQQVRALWARFFPTRPKDEAVEARPPHEDPVHYGLIIAGVMLLAFGVLIFSFTTLYELMTDTPPSG